MVQVLMRPISVLVASYVFAILVFAVSAIKLSKVHAVDGSRPHLPGVIPSVLFRGNMPRDDSVEFDDCARGRVSLDRCFGYQQLSNYTRIRAAEELSMHLPVNQSFSLVDVSLLSMMAPEEPMDLKIEQSFFQRYSEKGMLLHWPIYGAAQCPNISNLASVELLARSHLSWDKDRLHSLTGFLYETVHGQEYQLRGYAHSLPVRTYVHCEHGMDRTGQVLMSYEMRYLGRSWKQVLTYSNAVGARPVQPENRCAAQWYCFYLYYVEKMPLLDCAWSPPA